MADIPVERRSGMPGWVWLLLALLLILLLFLLLGRGCGDDVEDVVLTDTTATMTPPDTAVDDGFGDDLNFSGPADIEDLNLLFERGRTGAAVGQTVRLNDVAVTNVTGDSTFYVGSGGDNALVVLEDLGESQTGMGADDGRYAIQDGDTLDLVGRVAALDEGMRGRWAVRTDAAQDYYIRARRVDN